MSPLLHSEEKPWTVGADPGSGYGTVLSRSVGSLPIACRTRPVASRPLSHGCALGHSRRDSLRISAFWKG